MLAEIFKKIGSKENTREVCNTNYLSIIFGIPRRKQPIFVEESNIFEDPLIYQDLVDHCPKNRDIQA